VFHRTPFMAAPAGWVMFPKRELHFDRGWLPAGRAETASGSWPGGSSCWRRTSKPMAGRCTTQASEFGLYLSANDFSCGDRQRRRVGV
jgi:hypothetical protein